MPDPRYIAPIPAGIQQQTADLYVRADRSSRSHNWLGAFALYEQVYELLLKAQPPGLRFHKGQALHNMALSRLFSSDSDGAFEFVVLAFLEDAQTKADEGRSLADAVNQPAAELLANVFRVPMPALRKYAARVRKLVASGKVFPDPSDLQEVLGAPELKLTSVRRRGLPAGIFSDRVLANLRSAGFEPQTDVAIESVRVDIAIQGDAGLLVVELLLVDPKRPGPSAQQNAARLGGLARGLRTVSVVGVVEDRWAGLLAPFQNVVIERDLPQRVRSIVGQSEPLALSIRATSNRPLVFAAMPFSSAYDDTFYVAIRQSAQHVGAVAHRVDHNPHTGDVVDEIKELIRKAAIVVADVSESRPSVLHEYGFAEAVGRPVVAITSTGLDKLPFNVSHNATISYEKGRTDELRRNLTRRLREELRRMGAIPPSNT